jgi:hypothetical protein
MTNREKYALSCVNYLLDHHVYKLPVEPEKIAAIYNIKLVSASDYINQGMDKETLFDIWGNRDGSAMSCGRRHVINYNDQTPITRRRFTIAEELMHILLGHTRDKRFSVFSQDYSPEVYDEYEHEAKTAAGLLLMPLPIYFRYHPYRSLEAIANACMISNACAFTSMQYIVKNEAELRELSTHKRIDCGGILAPQRFAALDVWPEAVRY